MPGTPTITAFNGLAPPWSLASLDANFVNTTALLASFNNYSNYLVDTGAANAYVVTLGAGQTASLAAGLPVQFKAINANTGASTLNANATGVKNILNPNGSALTAGQIQAGAIVSVMYDGTQYMMIGAQPSSYMLAKSAVIATCPVDTTEDALATISVPANALGVNGVIRLTTLWSLTNNVNVKTARARFSGAAGQTYLGANFAGTSTVEAKTQFANRSATNSQVGNSTLTSNAGGLNMSTPNVTSAVDTTAATTIVITMQKATAGDAVSLESYTCELFSG